MCLLYVACFEYYYQPHTSLDGSRSQSERVGGLGHIENVGTHGGTVRARGRHRMAGCITGLDAKPLCVGIV